ncbi:helix-turn-helix domain-containing protein [Tersicoccus sp. Bi-70]|uniref:helix-turn-helix domain-containing protein n=1 Tax=Tersicoccus sp. Bi-70 TaxID=1897634 RepID=UPI000976A330|nr:helix-turn-helix domain-containing protein [Tersicoccus sp. Bi-70]OMH30674.1 hypothetical protein BGP79_11995 [Tersicoccus sp. Bi-70]
MSIQATSWALYSVDGLAPAQRLILLVLADHAHNDGTAAFPSYATIADAVGLSRRQVMRQVLELETLGLIRRGDQRHVAHVDARYRPVVWDLALEPSERARNVTQRVSDAVRAPRTRPARQTRQKPDSRGDARDTTETGPRGDTSDTTGSGSGVTFSTPRGDISGDIAMSPKPMNHPRTTAAAGEHATSAPAHTVVITAAGGGADDAAATPAAAASGSTGGHAGADRRGELLQARIRENRKRRAAGLPPKSWTDLGDHRPDAEATR